MISTVLVVKTRRLAQGGGYPVYLWRPASFSSEPLTPARRCLSVDHSPTIFHQNVDEVVESSARNFQRARRNLSQKAGLAVGLIKDATSSTAREEACAKQQRRTHDGIVEWNIGVRECHVASCSVPTLTRGEAGRVRHAMARCSSLRSRNGAPIHPDILSEITNSKSSKDPLDFFGAIRGLVEQSVSPEDLERYAPPRELQRGAEFPASTASGFSAPSRLDGIVEELRIENGLLRQRVAELEGDLEQLRQQQQLRLQLHPDAVVPSAERVRRAGARGGGGMWSTFE